MNGSPIRFTGLFSGMDTQSMVQQLMRAESMRMDRLTRRRTTLAWRQEQLRESSSFLNAFRTDNTMMNPASNSTALSNSRIWNQMNTAVTNMGDGSTAGFNVSVGANATQGRLEVYVHQTASASTVTGTQIPATGNSSLDLSRRMGDFMSDVFGSRVQHNGRDVYTFRVGNVDIRGTFTDEDTFEEIVASGAPRIFKRAANGNFADGNVSLGQRSAAVAEFANSNNAHITINDIQFSVQANETISQFMNRVNADTRNNNTFRINYSIIGRNFEVTGLGAGATSSVTLGVPSDDATNGGGRGNMVLNNFGFAAANRSGSAQTAIIRVTDQNGVITEIEQNNNQFNIAPGVTINVGASTAGETFEINITRDVDAIIEAIDDFISNFNDMMRHLNSLTSTPRPRTNTRAFFEPLTDLQRSEMSDVEIERWEEQARTGLLHRDDGLRQVVDRIRSEIWNDVTLGFHRAPVMERQFNNTTQRWEEVQTGTRIEPFRMNLSQLGITSGGGTAAERNMGLLHRPVEDGQPDRLREMLESDPDAVRLFFTQMTTQSRNHGDSALPEDTPLHLITDSHEWARRTLRQDESLDRVFFPAMGMPAVTNAERNARIPMNGIISRIDDIILNATHSVYGTISTRAGADNSGQDAMSRQIQNYDMRIEVMQRWLLRRENHYFAMFARMETAMAEANAQMDSLWMFGNQ